MEKKVIDLHADIRTYHNSLLSNIAFFSIELSREVLSKAGFYTSDAIKKAIDSKTHHWYKSSRYGITYDPSVTSTLGVMEYEKGNIVNPGSLSNFVGFFTMEKNPLRPTTVVAGSFPTHRPIKRVDGKRVGFMKTQKGVGMASLALLARIDQGRYTPDYEKYFGENRTIYNPRAYNVIAQGQRDSFGKVNTAINEAWEKSMNVIQNRSKLQAEVFAV